MAPVRLPAHFDGEHIRLDVPFELAPDTRLIITVLATEEDPMDREDWLGLAAAGLERAYGEHEPDYSVASLASKNPDYEGS